MRNIVLLLSLGLFACSSNVEGAAAAVNNGYDVACECGSLSNTRFCTDTRRRFSDEEIDCVETVLNDFPEIDYACEEQAALRFEQCVSDANCNALDVAGCRLASSGCRDHPRAAQERIDACIRR